MDKPLFIFNVINPRSDTDVVWSLMTNFPIEFEDQTGDLDISIRWNDDRTAAKCIVRAVSQPAEAQ
jgi:hypothetical protein